MPQIMVISSTNIGKRHLWWYCPLVTYEAYVLRMPNQSLYT